MKRWGTVLAGIVVVGVCAASAPAVLGSGSFPVPPTATAGPGELVAYDSCDEVLSRLRATERPHLAEYGRGGGYDLGGVVVMDQAAAAPDARKAAPAAPQDAGSPTH